MKTTGVKDVPKKILLVFLGHPNIDCSDDVSTDNEAMENQRFLLRTDPCNQGLVAQGR